MAHPNDELIVRFYDAFARGDGDTMAACYAPNAHFSDPVFTNLRGEEPGAMWRMLTGRAKDLEVRLAEHRDSFSFYAWARQALGPAGQALGWTPLLRGKVQREARAGLDEFLGNRS
jgi:hypothetical protein